MGRTLSVGVTSEKDPVASASPQKEKIRALRMRIYFPLELMLVSNNKLPHKTLPGWHPST